MDITLYTFEDSDGHEFGTFATTDPDKAKQYARENKLRMIANTYEWSDSELAEDYTK